MTSDFFSLGRIRAAFLPVLSGINITFGIMAAAFAIALILGICLMIIRIKHIPALEQLAAVYISFMRGTPIIVQLYLIYYGLPYVVMLLFHININRWDKIFFVTLAIGLNEASFFAEIIRGAILSVPQDQVEAGLSVGLTWLQNFRRVIAPQAMKVALPAMVVELITLLQSTALAYMFGIMDVISRAREMGSKLNHQLEPYICAAIIFIATCIMLELASRLLNRLLNPEEAHRSLGSFFGPIRRRILEKKERKGGFSLPGLS
jgi:L-cystine transport system permease protein